MNFWHIEAIKQVTVQHGHAADGASRPQDRGFFESWYRLDLLTDLLVRRR